MNTSWFTGLALALFAASPAGAAADPFRFKVDVSQDPEVSSRASEIRDLCQEWYPKINEILFGAENALSVQEITIIFGHQKIVGYTGTREIHISSDWLKLAHVQEYRAVAIHELTHIAQGYHAVSFRADGWRILLQPFQPLRIRRSQAFRMNWLTEGIADYVTLKYYTKDLEPRLRLDRNGRLRGYTDASPHLFRVQQEQISVKAKGYRKGYAVTAAFLLWLEEQKDRSILRTLNTELRARRYSGSVFPRTCGASLDRLWNEFLAQ